jgi:DNA-binding TFAR19-related protein (PDSD5 family)
MPSSGMLRCVALVRRDVSEELSASIIKVTRIGELGSKLDVTSNRRTLEEIQSTSYISSKLVSVAS